MRYAMASDLPRTIGFFRLLSLVLFLLSRTQIVSAIQVTPNSPCSSACIDSSNLDVSDPNSSNTDNSDLSCDDSDFTSSTAGQKWQSCLSCLQNSTFSQSSESDQDWFFYNLRYNFGYCIFGYPNASDVGSSPCQTSTACGPLLDAIKDGIPSMGNQSEYDYCGVDGSAMTGEFYSKCLSCVSAGGTTNVIANTLVALEAGCLQKLSSNVSVGLSDSIFSTSVISITEASSTVSSSGGSHTSHLAATTLAGIAIASVVGVAILAGAGFVLYRKNRVQRLRNSEVDHSGEAIKIDTFGKGGGGDDIFPSSAVSAGIGNLGWNTPQQSRTTSPCQRSVATMPGPESAQHNMAFVAANALAAATDQSPIEKKTRPGLPPSPLQVSVQFTAADSMGDFCPPPYSATKSRSGNRLDKLSTLPQLTTSLSTAAHLPSPSPVSAVSTIHGEDLYRSVSNRQRHPPSLSTASSFTHTPFQYGYGSRNASPLHHGSPNMATPTSATALIPSAVFPATTMSPAAQLRQQQVRSAIAAYTPSAYGMFGGKGGIGDIRSADPTWTVQSTVLSPDTTGLGTIYATSSAFSAATDGSTLSHPVTRPESTAGSRNLNDGLSQGVLGRLDHMDMESTRRMNEASQQKTWKRGSRLRNGHYDFSPASPGGSGTGSPVSTRSIQVQFLGPPSRK